MIGTRGAFVSATTGKVLAGFIEFDKKPDLHGEIYLAGTEAVFSDQVLDLVKFNATGDVEFILDTDLTREDGLSALLSKIAETKEQVSVENPFYPESDRSLIFEILFINDSGTAVADLDPDPYLNYVQVIRVGSPYATDQAIIDVWRAAKNRQARVNSELMSLQTGYINLFNTFTDAEVLSGAIDNILTGELLTEIAAIVAFNL